MVSQPTGASEISVIDASLFLTADSTTITNQVGDNNYRNGLYLTSVSSISGSSFAYKGFDNTASTFWDSKSDGSGYGQTPYSGGNYRGGIGYGNYASTTVELYGNKDGEWIQIRLPYSLFLTSYSIANRSGSWTGRFSKKFYVTGSNDGLLWYMIDNKVLTSNPDAGNGNIVNFTVTTPISHSYRYFRMKYLEVP